MLLDYQKRIIEKSKNKNKVAFFLDMGLGKSLIATYHAFNNLKAKQILVLTRKSLIFEWVNHFKKFHDINEINILNKKTNPNIVEGVNITNNEQFYAIYKNYIVNVETLIIDESSFLSNNSKMTNLVKKINCKNLILLSGTPTSNGKYEQLINQLKMLDIKMTKSYFLQNYAFTREVWYRDVRVTEIIGYKNIENFKREIASKVFFLKSEEVLDLPQMNEKIISYKLPKIHFTISQKKDIDSLTKRLELKYCLIDYKIDLLKDLKDEISKFIIFYNYNNELEKLQELFPDALVINGSCSDFNKVIQKNPNILLIQFKSGSMGLNLQAYNNIIYFSLCESFSQFEQSKKRIHRLNQNKACFYYYLIANGSIDYYILKALKQKKSYNDELFRKDFE